MVSPAFFIVPPHLSFDVSTIFSQMLLIGLLCVEDSPLVTPQELPYLHIRGLS